MLACEHFNKVSKFQDHGGLVGHMDTWPKSPNKQILRRGSRLNWKMYTDYQRTLVAVKILEYQILRASVDTSVPIS